MKTKFFYIQRWTASKEKLEGKTIRESPSEHTWELVFVDDGTVQWFRLAGDLYKREVFGISVKTEREEAEKFLRSLKQNSTLIIEPGSFLNDSKRTLVFVRLMDSGDAEVLEDEQIKRFKVKDHIIVLSPRKDVPGQFRVHIAQKPGESMNVEKFSLKYPKLEIIEDKDNPDVVTLKNVPVAKAGVWNGVSITKKILDGLKLRFERLKKKLYVPLKLDHKDDEEKTPAGPALGWLTQLVMVGDALFGTFVKVPKAVARLIQNGQYIGVSPEIARNFDGIPDVLVGVALLGAAIPAMTDLPRLLTLYAEKEEVETYLPPIPFSAFGGDIMTTNTEVPEVINVINKLVFQRQTSAEELSPAIETLRLKRYPRVLATEMIELLPDASPEKLDIVPEYTLEMFTKRLEVLDDRANQPEKCEKIIDEIEETLSIFEQELQDEKNAKIKEDAERILAKAKENKGTTEVEEAVEKEKTEGETTDEAPAELPKEETYPKVPENVKIDIEKMNRELKSRALGLVKATVDKFQLRGFDSVQCQKLEEVLIQLDPVLTPKPDTNHVRTLVFQLLGLGQKRIDTFERYVKPEDTSVDYVATILNATKRSRANR